MKKDIVLYNHCHNGDIFYSRILVNILIKHFNVTYYHRLRRPLFKDLTEVNEVIGIPKECEMDNTNLESYIVNTWIGQKGYIYINNQVIPGCSFNNHFKLVKDICDFYKISLTNNLEDYLPTIIYEKLPQHNKIIEQLNFLKSKYKLIILVCDGEVQSSQSYNFNFLPIIELLSINNTDCLFLSTNQLYPNNNNVINTHSQITEELPDLLEISLISNYCDIIIGRASGPFCFTHTKNNFNSPNKTFISFTHHESEGVFYSEGDNKSVWSNNFNYDNIIEIIQKEINLKLTSI
jgi:hypothetical protein